MKDMEYSYEYDDDGKYCYHDSNVLKNKLNIRDLDTLHDAEREFSMARYFDMETQGVTGDFSLGHMKLIHYYLFQDIYEWAGEINMIHPFREGNGRTQRMYLEQLCKLNGNFEINFSYATKEEMIQASIDTSVCKYESMIEIFNKCLVTKN